MGSIVRARDLFTTSPLQTESFLRSSTSSLDNVYSKHLLESQCIDLQFVFTFLVLVNLFILELGERERNYFVSSQVLLHVTLRNEGEVGSETSKYCTSLKRTSASEVLRIVSNCFIHMMLTHSH